MTAAYIYAGFRSPFGRQGGALATLRPDDLLAQTIASTLAKTKLDPDLVEDVIMGCSNQAGEDSRNVARNAALLAGLPTKVGGETVNRLCGSGLAAIVNASRAVRLGEGDAFIAGGVESMSRAPFVMGKSEQAFSRIVNVFDSTIGSRFPNPQFLKMFGDDTLAQTADNVGFESEISRDECDEFAARSQKKYEKARLSGVFESEIVPITVPIKNGTVTVSADEHPRPDTDLARLARLKAIHDGGVTTAGNASGINDGAAALVIGDASLGERANLHPVARIVSSAVVGVEPRVMGLGPVEAIKKALVRAKITLADVDLIEINEAFAAQALACLKLLGVQPTDSRFNPNGGAIAVGHPLGASGARIAIGAANYLQRTSGRFAVISMCIGLGQGIAVVLERAE